MIDEERETILLSAIRDMVDILGCGGEERYTPAHDPYGDGDREALIVAKTALNEIGEAWW